MCLDRAQLEDYNQNNYSGLTPASGLLANDRHNTDDSILSRLHLYVTRARACLCLFERSDRPATFADWLIKKNYKNNTLVVIFCNNR